MEIVYGVLLFVGVGYLILMTLSGLGESFDFGMDGAFRSLKLDTAFGLGDLSANGAAELKGVGCGVLAAFMAGFGGIGFTATRAGWPALVALVVAIAVGYVLGFAVARLMRVAILSQSTERFSSQDLIGHSARVTIHTPPGATGEAMIEDGQVVRYAIREVNGVELNRGDLVVIVAVEGNQLRVRKQDAP